MRLYIFTYVVLISLTDLEKNPPTIDATFLLNDLATAGDASKQDLYKSLTETKSRSGHKHLKSGSPKIPVSTLLDRVQEIIFPDNTSPPSLPWRFPEPNTKVADTPQLVTCLSLLMRNPDDFSDETLEPIAHKWLQDTAQNADERDRLETLADNLIRAFNTDELKDSKSVAEVLCLVPVLPKDNFQSLLRLFIGKIEDSILLDLANLRGLGQLLRTAPQDHLHAQDLILIFELIGKIGFRLQDTHFQSLDQILEVTVAVISILDAMADTKVTGLKRVELHEPLLSFLARLQSSDDPHLKYYATYAFQALLCVPDDETLWQAAIRKTSKFVRSISGVVGAVEVTDIDELMSGLKSIHEGSNGVQIVAELTETANERDTTVFEGEQDIIVGLQEGLAFNRKRIWYLVLRCADALVDRGELAKLKALVFGAPCRHEIAFQWGICQRLGSIAANKLWSEKTRRDSVRFLEEIYRKGDIWGQSRSIKAYILDILRQLSVVSHEIPG